MDITRLPLDQIDANALPRDRLTLDAPDLAALQDSIATEGLRQPVEVFPIHGPQPWGLISGLRRLTAFRALDALRPGAYATIPAFIRQPADVPTALALMVSENEIRAPVTPWEKGALLLTTTRYGLFANPESAADALYPALSRQARSRLRGFAQVVQTLDGLLTDPRTLSTARMDRLAAACRAGLDDLMIETLRAHPGESTQAQWSALLPVVAEALLTPEDDTHPQTLPNRRAPRPRRVLRLHSGITLRREWTPQGWLIRIDARHAAHPGIVDDILDLVERWFQKG